MILYHGSHVEVRNPQLLQNQRELDFGKGFDCVQNRACPYLSALYGGCKSMKKQLYFVTDYYDRHVIERIMQKYNMEAMAAVRSFINSETHALLEDAENGLSSFPERAIFDMWETEKITGSPLNSIWLRGE